MPPKLDAPVLMENRPLQAFHEPVGPRMPRLRPRVVHLVGGTGRDKACLELLAVVGQHPPQALARGAIARQHDLGQEHRHQRGGDFAHDDPRPAERRGAIARRQLPDLAYAFQFPHVEAVE